MGILKDQYFKQLRETSAKVWPLIEQQAHAVSSTIKKEIEVDVERYLSLRRGKPLMRPQLGRLCLEMIPDLKWEEYLPILAAIELVNISSYQSNFCFDGKGGVYSRSDINNQFICSMITFSGALELAGSLESDDNFRHVVRLFTESNQQIYEGQFCDLNILSINNIDKFSSEEKFLTTYIERCRLIGGSTFRACGAVLANHFDNAKVEFHLMSYLEALGTAGQMINDLADFIPVETRCYAAPLADLKLGRLTLPVYLLHKEGYPVRKWRESLMKQGDGSSCCQLIQNALLDLDIEKATRSLIRTRIFPDVKKAIRGLSHVFSKPSVEPLRFAFHFVYESKLLTYFNKGLREKQWR